MEPHGAQTSWWARPGVGAAYVRLANLQRPTFWLPPPLRQLTLSHSGKRDKGLQTERSEWRVVASSASTRSQVDHAQFGDRRITQPHLTETDALEHAALSQAERRTKHGLQRDSGLDGRIYDRCSWPSLSGWIRDARVPRFQIHNRTLAALCPPGLQPESSRKWHKSARFCGTRSDRASQELISVREARTSFWIGLFSI
jgi:hypothetical protein